MTLQDVPWIRTLQDILTYPKMSYNMYAVPDLSNPKDIAGYPEISQLKDIAGYPRMSYNMYCHKPMQAATAQEMVVIQLVLPSAN